MKQVVSAVRDSRDKSFLLLFLEKEGLAFFSTPQGVTLFSFGVSAPAWTMPSSNIVHLQR